MKYLFNGLRDYTQIDGINWLFVGDIGLRKFIAQKVDRLDDIISYEVKIKPLEETEFAKMLKKRFEHYKSSVKVVIPVDMAVFTYLYTLTSGRLRYIFGLVSRLMHSLSVGDLTDKITIELAKPMLTKLAKDRVMRTDITSSEEAVLKLIVNMKKTNLSDLANSMRKSRQYVGRVIANLQEKQLISIKKIGNKNSYYPSLDATIAYLIEKNAI
jgi:predicted transcriptional regulator